MNKSQLPKQIIIISLIMMTLFLQSCADSQELKRNKKTPENKSAPTQNLKKNEGLYLTFYRPNFIKPQQSNFNLIESMMEEREVDKITPSTPEIEREVESDFSCANLVQGSSGCSTQVDQGYQDYILSELYRRPSIETIESAWKLLSSLNQQGKPSAHVSKAITGSIDRIIETVQNGEIHEKAEVLSSAIGIGKADLAWEGVKFGDGDGVGVRLTGTLESSVLPAAAQGFAPHGFDIDVQAGAGGNSPGAGGKVPKWFGGEEDPTPKERVSQIIMSGRISIPDSQSDLGSHCPEINLYKGPIEEVRERVMDHSSYSSVTHHTAPGMQIDFTVNGLDTEQQRVWDDYQAKRKRYTDAKEKAEEAAVKFEGCTLNCESDTAAQRAAELEEARVALSTATRARILKEGESSNVDRVLGIISPAVQKHITQQPLIFTDLTLRMTDKETLLGRANGTVEARADVDGVNIKEVHIATSLGTLTGSGYSDYQNGEFNGHVQGNTYQGIINAYYNHSIGTVSHNGDGTVLGKFPIRTQGTINRETLSASGDADITIPAISQQMKLNYDGNFKDGQVNYHGQTTEEGNHKLSVVGLADSKEKTTQGSAAGSFFEEVAGKPVHGYFGGNYDCKLKSGCTANGDVVAIRDDESFNVAVDNLEVDEEGTPTSGEFIIYNPPQEEEKEEEEEEKIKTGNAIGATFNHQGKAPTPFYQTKADGSVYGVDFSASGRFIPSKDTGMGTISGEAADGKVDYSGGYRFNSESFQGSAIVEGNYDTRTEYGKVPFRDAVVTVDLNTGTVFAVGKIDVAPGIEVDAAAVSEKNEDGTISTRVMVTEVPEHFKHPPRDLRRLFFENPPLFTQAVRSDMVFVNGTYGEIFSDQNMDHLVSQAVFNGRDWAEREAEDAVNNISNSVAETYQEAKAFSSDVADRVFRFFSDDENDEESEEAQALTEELVEAEERVSQLSQMAEAVQFQKDQIEVKADQDSYYYEEPSVASAPNTYRPVPDPIRSRGPVPLLPPKRINLVNSEDTIPSPFQLKDYNPCFRTEALFLARGIIIYLKDKADTCGNLIVATAGDGRDQSESNISDSFRKLGEFTTENGETWVIRKVAGDRIKDYNYQIKPLSKYRLFKEGIDPLQIMEKALDAVKEKSMPFARQIALEQCYLYRKAELAGKQKVCKFAKVLLVWEELQAQSYIHFLENLNLK